MRLLKGYAGTYKLDERPFAFGRSSLLFDARTDNRELVAVKVFRTEPTGENNEEFFNEIRTQSRLSHPNILRVLDYGASPDSAGEGPFVVLPKCGLGNLRQKMKGRDFFPVSLAAEILLPIARAVDHAHSKGVIHGDIKPENILFGDGEEPYLADFGVAKYFPISERVTTQRIFPGRSTSSGGGGSTAYMGPEQIEDGLQSPRSDIYSLATMAYELLTGVLPFDVRQTPYRQMSAKIAGRLSDPRSVNHLLSPHTAEVLMSALSTDRSRRPESAAGFIEVLTADAHKEELPAPKPARSVFVSYSHEDEKWVRKIESFLKPLIRNGQLQLWSDRRIEAGSKWRAEIEAALASAQTALLLVSPNFLNSDFIAKDELPPLLAAAKSRGVRILWIAVSGSLYRASPLAEFQALNDPRQPLDLLTEGALNMALVGIGEKIMGALKAEGPVTGV